MIIFHGGKDIIKNPQFGVGRPDNDYGSGYYTTQDPQKAAEWALGFGDQNKDGIVNQYRLNENGLNILHLDDYGPLVWIAELLSNRTMKYETKDMSDTAEILVEQYKIDTSDIDVIIGCRAGNGYTNVLESFLKEEITVDEAVNLMKKDDLGEQIFIKSQKAFDAITFIGHETIAKEKATEVNLFKNNPMESIERRIREIYSHNYVPKGITALDAATEYFAYDKDTGYLFKSEKVKEQISEEFDLSEGDYEYEND